MQKKHFCLLVGLVVLAGCGKKNKKASTVTKPQAKVAQIDIPMADSSAEGFFYDDVNEFNLVQSDFAGTQEVVVGTAENDYAWVEEEAKSDSFKVVYFDFDRHSIHAGQEEALSFDVELAKKEIARAEKKGQKACLLVEGHGCHAAGSATYNVAKSVERAKSVRDHLVAAGIPQENIKIVGRGKEVPAVIDGELVTGDRARQWPNRRSELRVVAA